MDTAPPPFGILLRRWRQHRRLSQLELAETADSSTRYLSTLETGRATPSRDMVLRLADYLDVPLRERNAMLLAAGFAPCYEERGLAELTAARQAIDQILNAHKPYPAFAVDRHWNVILSNSALPRLYDGCAPELLKPPINAIRLLMHPHGMAARILNMREWRWHVITVLRQQIRARPDPRIEDLLDEVIGYAPDRRAELEAIPNSSQQLAVPIKFATDFGTMSFLGTTTVFGTPTEVTLSELALEMWFPADAETAAVAARMQAEDG
ncbi:helix-turn-helix domain-containing protein [Acidisphaera sp. S103]|uniref:helix-turn-helix domain-containing protein n=1 Tax=Acidisphaera sp. S103 TaxID=1747223 RepID=UPI00131B5565|nr:helix-turn-helix transcriptional regulator [Acidisphaera sp. S103]